MSKSTILLIDDEQDVLMLMGQMLQIKGYNVVTADNGVEGKKLAASEKPDVIILDISMPGMDGGQVAEELKESPETKDIPIIFLTGLLTKEIEANNRNLVGGNIMFAKPVNIEKLVKKIQSLTRPSVRIH
jgi:response regulator RpfG family c-di-GMP phosphodiesterase